MLMKGGAQMDIKYLKLGIICIIILFIIIALGTIPGTIGHKTKYVKKDDPESELKLSDVSIPVSLLSFSLLLLFVLLSLSMKIVKKALNSSNSTEFSTI